MMFVIRLLVMGDLMDFAMETSKILRNCFNDVWYMVFTILISTIKKYRTLPRVATTNQQILGAPCSILGVKDLFHYLQSPCSMLHPTIINDLFNVLLMLVLMNISLTF